MTDSIIVPPLVANLWPEAMTRGRTSSVRTFFVATYVVAYSMWGLVALAVADVVALPIPMIVLLFAGGLSPTLAAFGMAYVESGIGGVTALLGTVFRWRVARVWYAAAVAGPALVVIAGIGTGLAVGGPLPPLPSASAWFNALALVPLFLVFAVIEELGWRGYALPRLHSRAMPLRASVLLGVAWALWHAPQWFIPQTGQAAFPFPAFVIWVVALSIQLTWIYNGTRGSVLLVVLAHAGTNAFQGPWAAALATLPESARGVDPRLLVFVPQVVLSALIVIATRGRLGSPAMSPPRIAVSGRRIGDRGLLVLSGLFASLTALVSYDRAGLGWSDVGSGPRDARQSAMELHTALHASGIAGPYLLAGHSYGGLVSRLFVDLFPDEVVGLVLVDASHPDQWAHIPESLDGNLTATSNRVLSSLATVGFLRMYDPVTPQVASGLPEHQYAAMRANFAAPQSSAIGADILAAWSTRTRPEVNAAHALGSLPLAVLSVTEQPRYGEVLTMLQAELPTLSTNSVRRVIAGATHENLISDRVHAAVVAETILQLGTRERV